MQHTLLLILSHCEAQLTAEQEHTEPPLLAANPSGQLHKHHPITRCKTRTANLPCSSATPGDRCCGKEALPRQAAVMTEMPAHHGSQTIVLAALAEREVGPSELL